MRIEYIYLSHYGLAKLVKWNFADIDNLFVRINSVGDNLLDIKKDEVALLDQLDPTKIIFILYLGSFSLKDPQVPSSVLSNFDVINYSEAYVEPIYNFIPEESWRIFWENDKINVLLLKDPQTLTFLSDTIYRNYIGVSILIVPKLDNHERLLKFVKTTTQVYCGLPGKTSKNIELVKSCITIN